MRPTLIPSWSTQSLSSFLALLSAPMKMIPQRQKEAERRYFERKCSAPLPPRNKPVDCSCELLCLHSSRLAVPQCVWEEKKRLYVCSRSAATRLKPLPWHSNQLTCVSRMMHHHLLSRKDAGKSLEWHVPWKPWLNIYTFYIHITLYLSPLGSNSSTID